MQLTLCVNAYGDFTDFEICRFHKNKNLNISNENYFFLQIKKIINLTSWATILRALLDDPHNDL